MENTKEYMINTKDDLVTKDHELESEVFILKEHPFFHACGYIQHTHTIPISYSNLLNSSTNIVFGDLDISTCPYTVTWSLFAVNDAGDHEVNIYMRKL